MEGLGATVVALNLDFVQLGGGTDELIIDRDALDENRLLPGTIEDIPPRSFEFAALNGLELCSWEGYPVSGRPMDLDLRVLPQRRQHSVRVYREISTEFVELVVILVFCYLCRRVNQDDDRGLADCQSGLCMTSPRHEKRQCGQDDCGGSSHGT